MLKIVSKIARNGQLTIPSRIRNILHIKDGDLVRFDIKNAQLLVTPVSIVNKDQAYFFTKEWKESVKKSEESIKKGKYSVYHSAEELRKDIEE